MQGVLWDRLGELKLKLRMRRERRGGRGSSSFMIIFVGYDFGAMFREERKGLQGENFQNVHTTPCRYSQELELKGCQEFFEGGEYSQPTIWLLESRGRVCYKQECASPRQDCGRWGADTRMTPNKRNVVRKKRKFLCGLCVEYVCNSSSM